MMCSYKYWITPAIDVLTVETDDSRQQQVMMQDVFKSTTNKECIKAYSSGINYELSERNQV